MKYLALYRKYRPKELNEVVGQSEIKKILASSVKNGTITHAYLFSGPRGTGKTTMAKILAKMVNCEHPVDGNACGKCTSCLNVLNSSDVIEIDAASNNGVDEIRDLREKANLVPSGSKYKVYIIDEVHMLTTQAFNALLKTLEEPPSHVIFILATTEYYKIPLTITSRCQKFQFNKISNEDIVFRLREIATAESIDVLDDALYEIAKVSDGGMRDSINFLDQLRSFSNKTITIDDVYDVCGNVSIREMTDLFINVRNNALDKVVNFLESLSCDGKNYGKFLEDVACLIKDVVLYKEHVNSKYIKSDVSYVKKIDGLYTLSDLFYVMDNINGLIDKLKTVSRQSVIVISVFLLIANRLNGNALNEISDVTKDDVDTGNVKYDMAFDLSNVPDSHNDKLTVNNLQVQVDLVSEKTENYFVDKDSIINNAFALASKDLKNDLQNKYSSLDNYFTNKKFSSVAGSLLDVELQVAGNGYVVFSAKYDAIIDKIYNNYKLCNELINKLFDGEYKYIVISSEEWDKYRNEYIRNIRSGKKYELREVNNFDTAKNKLDVKETTIVDKLFDLVGEDIVEFK